LSRVPNSLVNDVDLHYLEWGAEGAPLAVLLHGFPDSAHTWRHLGPELASAGYHAVAPFLRGYAPSAVPADGRYQTGMLASDALELRRALGGDERAVIVGHDWGASATWSAAAFEPSAWARVVGMAVPPAGLIGQAFMRFEQLKRSWYMFFFQLPRLPERALRKDDYENLVKSLRWTSRRGTFTEEDVRVYREAWAQPGALTGMLNWYRAGLRVRSPSPAGPRVTVPTLLVWGTKDRALGEELAQPSIDLCDHGRLARIEEATHWLQHEEPERVNALIGDFFG
jgi:pimeloyl-ACP methyl ester carboxylesterase